MFFYSTINKFYIINNFYKQISKRFHHRLICYSYHGVQIHKQNYNINKREIQQSESRFTRTCFTGSILDLLAIL